MKCKNCENGVVLGPSQVKVEAIIFDGTRGHTNAAELRSACGLSGSGPVVLRRCMTPEDVAAGKPQLVSFDY